MKKLKWLVTLLIATSLAFIGCSNGSDDADSLDIAPGTIGTADEVILAAAKASKADTTGDVLLYYYRPDGNYSSWGLWLWVGSGSGENGYNETSGKAQTTIVDGIKLGFWNLSAITDKTISSEISSSGKLGLIIRDASWNKDPGADQEIDLSLGKRFMIISKDSSVYPISDNISPSIVSAVSLSKTTLKVSLSVTLGLQTSASDNGFVITADDNTSVVVTDVVNYDAQNNRNRNNAKNLLVTLGSSLDPSKTYSIARDGFAPTTGTEISVLGAVKDSVTYNGNDLGLTINGSIATFKVWAPVASDVKLLVYSDVSKVGTFASGANPTSIGATTDVELYGTPATKPIQMTKDATTGIWSKTIDAVSSYKYYKYQIVNAGTTYYVCDTYAKAGSSDSIAAQIVDINDSSSGAIPSSTTDTAYGAKENYYNPFGKTGSETKSYSDAVVYEMHITDWSYAEDSTSTGNVGKYLTIANGTKVIAHLKDLGVTHVQLLPVFEFAETNANTKYNWGYNPYHYNLPEGRYVTATYEDGTQAVLELRSLIAKLHEAGIAVNMDVVYNHTSKTGAYSLYDSQVPYYFYRYDSNGTNSNGSGCGNEIDSEATMVKKYIIESLKHWMLDYHFNGFRFDLMGCLSKETMVDIYNALYEIDKNVMVYGEPWTGGTAAVVDGAVQAVKASSGYGVGAFDDDFRDAIKGAEFGGFKQGHVQGTFSDSGIIKGLKGLSGNNKRNETGELGLGLHYVECHDNYTLFDKLAISYWQNANNKTTTTSGDLFAKIGTDGLTEVKVENTLSAAYVLLSQGTSFLNGGQEFLRTKLGNENSYNTSNTTSFSTNGIDLSFATTYSDVYNTYKGLIALRKANPDAFCSNTAATAIKVVEGVTKYTTGNFLVYFNATSSDSNITTTGYTKVVNVSSGSVVEENTLPTTVPAKSFVILKK